MQCIEFLWGEMHQMPPPHLIAPLVTTVLPVFTTANLFNRSKYLWSSDRERFHRDNCHWPDLCSLANGIFRETFTHVASSLCNENTDISPHPSHSNALQDWIVGPSCPVLSMNSDRHVVSSCPCSHPVFEARLVSVFRQKHLDLRQLFRSSASNSKFYLFFFLNCNKIVLA